MPRTAKGAHRHTELEILRAIKNLRAATSHDIGKVLDLHHTWIEQKIKILKQANRIYISDWQKVHLYGPYRRVFSIVEDKFEDIDVKKPKPIPGSQKSSTYLKRKKLKELLNASCIFRAGTSGSATGT